MSFCVLDSRAPLFFPFSQVSLGSGLTKSLHGTLCLRNRLSSLRIGICFAPILKPGLRPAFFIINRFASGSRVLFAPTIRARFVPRVGSHHRTQHTTQHARQEPPPVIETRYSTASPGSATATTSCSKANSPLASFLIAASVLGFARGCTLEYYCTCYSWMVMCDVSDVMRCSYP